MGFFDISISEQSKDAKECINQLKERIEPYSKELVESKYSMEFMHFKPKGSLVNYNLKVENTKQNIFIEGELQNTLLITILIILSILLTYGLGVIVIVGYVYYQKRTVTHFLKALIANKSS
ncbi:hypothetical protein [Candidatus Marinarcus aquaticus]|uniref:Uncharacterized protein n=1 Tax=Candidatus Marinarcus aquaticus TaxID=2044504 RepID=A0A4Q0XT62_9BACT|nr:hypothetical protein [Candidatus Marinarcus aquaticus]RXJ60757.1 hypothetical protein CRV04_01720 [Candidatus Marinarcus aquaticus]